MMKLRINPLVVVDLKGIRNFIAEDNVEKAAETIEKIYGKFENIPQAQGLSSVPPARQGEHLAAGGTEHPGA